MIEKIPARVGMRAGVRLATYEPAAPTGSDQKHLDADNAPDQKRVGERIASNPGSADVSH